MRVLITASHGKQKLVKSFEEAGWTVVRTLLELPDLIIPTVDEELPFFALNRDWFKMQGIEVMIGSDFTVSTCRDKAEFNLFCIRHEFKTPPTARMNLHIKPRFGKGSKGIIKVDRSYIVQETCEFPEVSIDYFSDLNGHFVSAIPRYRLDVVNGESQAMEFVPDFKLDVIKRFGSELGLVGHNVIQGYWTGETFIFGEVNPRFGGGSHLTFDIFNSPKWLINTCMSQKKQFIISHPF